MEQDTKRPAVKKRMVGEITVNVKSLMTFSYYMSNQIGDLHVTALTDMSPCQYFWSVPLPRLGVLQVSWSSCLCFPAVCWTQSPQFSCQVSANQHAPSSNVAMDTALTMQVFLNAQIRRMLFYNGYGTFKHVKSIHTDKSSRSRPGVFPKHTT